MIVRAKRLGWNEKLTLEQFADLEPYRGHPDGDDLEGELFVNEFELNGKTYKQILVGGHEADPDSIVEV